MGLDCTAYKNIKKINEEDIRYDEYKDEEGNVVDKYPNNGIVFYINDISHAAKDIDGKAVYSYEESYGWRAGSYSGYNSWRNNLAKLAGWESDHDAWENGKLGDSFYELINFSDCEGTLGTEVCKKLLKDFIEFEDKVNKNDTYFYNLYLEWKKAFTIAAENGAISFH